MSRTFAFVCFIVSCGRCSTALGSRDAQASVTVWHPFEVALNASFEYEQPLPWWGLELNATFQHTDGGLSLFTPGFWDGGCVWRVRFAPPVVGNWNFSTTFSRANDSGLHGQTGSFVALPYTGDNPLYKHGIALQPVVAAAAAATGSTESSSTTITTGGGGPRYFQHNDGTPFYWFGDTHWSGYSTAEHWDDTNNLTVDPGMPSMLRQMMDVRASQGYSVWKAETFVINGQQQAQSDNVSAAALRQIQLEQPSAATATSSDGGATIANHGGPAWGGATGAMFQVLNPGFWRAIDDIIAYANSKGLVVSHAFAGIGRGLTSLDQVAPIKALARYNVARYAAFATVWTTCQEYCAMTPFADQWAEIAKVQYYLDPLHRSTSLHNCASNPLPAWRDEDWYGHVTLQQGHGRTSPMSYWLDQYHASPPRVMIEDEANYELLKYASMTSNIPAWLARQSAWQSQVGGATGFTYGGQGIWWACFNRTYVNGNCGPNDDPPEPRPASSGFYTWDEALDFSVGGHQLPAMAAFFRRLPWHTLAPDVDAIAWGPGLPTDQNQLPFQKADENLDYVVAYLPSPTASVGACRPAHNQSRVASGIVSLNASSGAHRIEWFNPRTAEFTALGIAPSGSSTFSIPATRPGGDVGGDWVLLVEPASVDPPPRTLYAAASGRQQITNPSASPLASGAFGDSRTATNTSPTPPQGVSSWVTHVDVTQAVPRRDVATVGCSFVAAQDMNVSHLCRYIVPGSINVQTVALVSNETGETIAQAEVDALAPDFVDENGFLCAEVADPTRLTFRGLHKGTAYVLLLSANGCDAWYDDVHSSVDVLGGCSSSNVQSVYGEPPHLSPGSGGLCHCYGPLNFFFHD